MDIYNKDMYYTQIYQAIVINTDKASDPEGLNRIQIYIPSINYNYEEQCKLYLTELDKNSSQYFSLFPWAVSLALNLQVGMVVYGSYIENKNDQFIILGIEMNSAEEYGLGSNNTNNTSSSNGSLNILGGNIIDLAMPIIIHNEVGISINAWPNGISDAQFTNINPFDNPGWSIGLIQWHHTRAFDILFDIASADPNWRNKWSDKSEKLYIYLDKAIAANSSSPYRNEFQGNMHPTKGTTLYNSIQNMLGSDIGKKVQLQKAQADTEAALVILQSAPYELTNIAIIIFILDIMNQYGNAVDPAVFSGLFAKAKTIEKTSSKDRIGQLDEFYSYFKTRTTKYLSRRQTTYNYIKDLDAQGKLVTSANAFTGLGEMATSNFIPEFGEYIWPLSKSDRINSYWGDHNEPFKYTFSYNSSSKHMGYPTWTNWHGGIDFNAQSGDPCLAVGSGTVRYVNFNSNASQGKCIGIQMDKNPNHYFVYMHLCKDPELKVGEHVTVGQVVGYAGTTGHSTGVHLHLGLHIGAVWPSGGKNNRDVRIDPLPYLGKASTETAALTGNIVSNTIKQVSSGLVNGANNVLDFLKGIQKA